MTEGRHPTWRPTLAKDVPSSDTHRIDLWEGPFGVRATCSVCTWEADGDDLAGLAGRAVVHAPRVRVYGPDGELVGDGARLQRQARRAWDRGDATTVSEVIGERINGDRQKEGRNVDEDQDEELDMSAEIRRQARAGSPLSQAAGERFAEAMRAEPEAEPTEEEQATAAIAAGRARSRRSRGLQEELAAEPEDLDVSEGIRGAAHSRRRGMDRTWSERLFGTDTQNAGDAGGKEE